MHDAIQFEDENEAWVVCGKLATEYSVKAISYEQAIKDSKFKLTAGCVVGYEGSVFLICHNCNTGESYVVDELGRKDRFFIPDLNTFVNNGNAKLIHNPFQVD